MKISLLVPSRERLNLKLTLISSIITTVSDISNISLYFGIDDDDPTREITLKICNAIPFVKFIPIHNNGKFIGLGKMWNELARNTSDDIFGYIGDDMIFKTPNWDILILNEFNNCPKDNIKLVHCNDGYHGPKLSVNAFVHRKYFELIGYFCREEFLINWSDQWMYQVFKAFNRVTYIPDMLIQHNHWVFGNRPKDSTADRMLSSNHDKISNDLWYSLAPERINEIKKLSIYLNETPDWSKVDLCGREI
jgi:hypothetical protein